MFISYEYHLTCT